MINNNKKNVANNFRFKITLISDSFLAFFFQAPGSWRKFRLKSKIVYCLNVFWWKKPYEIQMVLKVSWIKVVYNKFQKSYYDKQLFYYWLKFWLKSEIVSWPWGQLWKAIKRNKFTLKVTYFTNLFYKMYICCIQEIIEKMAPFFIHKFSI